MGHFSRTLSVCRFLSIFVLLLWKRIILRFATATCTVESRRLLRILRLLANPSQGDKLWLIPYGGIFCFVFSVKIFLSRCNKRSLTYRPNARHDDSLAQRLLTSICVLFNNSLNNPPSTFPAQECNTTAYWGNLSPSPLSSFIYSNGERQRPTGGVRQLSSISSSNSCSRSISLPLFRFASSPLPAE